jgi:hypothetical protein
VTEIIGQSPGPARCEPAKVRTAEGDAIKVPARSEARSMAERAT